VAGPVLTVRFTEEPLATLVPAAGDSLMTLPDATVLLLAMATAPTARPAVVMADVADACDDPTTFGTVTDVPPPPPPGVVLPLLPPPPQPVSSTATLNMTDIQVLAFRAFIFSS
jgi:hypothetical protein